MDIYNLRNLYDKSLCITRARLVNFGNLGTKRPCDVLLLDFCNIRYLGLFHRYKRKEEIKNKRR